MADAVDYLTMLAALISAAAALAALCYQIRSVEQQRKIREADEIRRIEEGQAQRIKRHYANSTNLGILTFDFQTPLNLEELRSIDHSILLYKFNREINPRPPDSDRVYLPVVDANKKVVQVRLSKSPPEMDARIGKMSIDFGRQMQKEYLYISYLWREELHGKYVDIEFSYRTNDGDDFVDRYRVKHGFANIHRVDPPIPGLEDLS